MIHTFTQYAVNKRECGSPQLHAGSRTCDADLRADPVPIHTLHYAAIPRVALGWNATALFGTNTFLRGYALRAHAMAFRSVRLVAAGAERVQPAVREMWMERFGLRILKGYGVTECAPVLAVNTPVSNRYGTVGRLLPGMTMRLAPVDGLPDAGRLSMAGPNVMAC